MLVNGTKISMTRGDSESITITCAERPFKQGDTIAFTVKENVYQTEHKIQKTVKEFADGKAVVEILPEDTRNLKFHAYIYDIQLTGADGSVKTIIKPSEFNILPEVTCDE